MKNLSFFGCTLLLILTVLVSSCTTYQAAIKKHENLQYEAVRVYPEWKYKEPKAKKWITPVIGLSAGAAYGYQNETTLDGETFSGAENAAIWAAGGLLAGLIVNGVLFPRKNSRKTKFDLSQSEQWVENYNKTTRSNYMIKDKELKNTLVLVPKDRVEVLREQYRVLLFDLKSTSPSITFNTLQDWKYQLKGKYSILPQSEINTISDALTQHEEKIADKDLLAKAKALTTLRNDYASIQEVSTFKDSNRTLYSAASSNARQITDQKVDGKLADILNSTLQKEEIALQQIEQNLNSTQALDAFYNNFDNKYRNLNNHPEVKRGYDTIIDKKTSIIRQSSNQISEHIKNADSMSQLRKIESQYFSNLDSEDYAVKNLSAQIQVRRMEIIEEEKRKAIAAEKRLKEQREQRRRILSSLPVEEQGIYLNELDFSTEGLRNERILMDIYRGDFANIPFDTEETEFAILFDAYINTFATYCASSLPADKIELTKQECATERVTRNGWGVETNRQCVSWVSVGTGLYASPKMHHAKSIVDRQQAADMLGKFWDILMQKDRIGSMMSLAGNAQTLKSDMIALIKMNGCNSPGLRRFEENLRLFALNKQAIRLGKTNLSESSTAIYSRQQDHEKLVEDLIYDQSKKWRINQYQSGSANNISIVSRDKLDRLVEITAKYSYRDFNGRRKVGSVRITFNEGLPDCLYFFDSPNTCKAADRRIVAEFADGQYQK